MKFRPFFKEAIDGLNLAQGRGSVYTVNDTSYRYNKLTGTFQKPRGREYPIDRYFKILKQSIVPIIFSMLIGLLVLIFAQDLAGIFL